MRKRIASVAILAGMAIALSGCSSFTNDPTTEEPLPNAGMLNGTQYRVATNWTRVPSNSDVITDMHIRLIEIQGMCYVQTASEKDWQFNLVLTNRECPTA